MEGKVYIDGIDIYTSFGAYVTKGGYNGLLSFPATKNIYENDWFEEDGIEPDLSSLQLDQKKFQMSFAFNRGIDGIEGFYELLMSKPYHDFNFAVLGLEMPLKLIGTNSLDYAKSLSFLTITLADDAPYFVDDNATEPSGLATDIRYTIDGEPFTNWGVRILKGSLNNLLKRGDAKIGMERNISILNGVIGDNGVVNVKTKSKSISLVCLLIARNISDALVNYYALLYTLVYKKHSKGKTKECVRTLCFDEYAKEIDCYYKSSNVTAFHKDKDKVWIQFTLTFVALSEFAGETGFYLDFEDMNLYVNDTDPNVDYYVDDDGYLCKIDV